VEHPYLFFVKLFEMFGFDHFAHTYPHVIYSWVVIVLLIVFGYMPAKAMSMVPGKVQNLLEVIISGIEDFMITVTGEEGRWLFPLAATVFLYILGCNLIGLVRVFIRQAPA